jgi:hypothetical protein
MLVAKSPLHGVFTKNQIISNENKNEIKNESILKSYKCLIFCAFEEIKVSVNTN